MRTVAPAFKDVAVENSVERGTTELSSARKKKKCNLSSAHARAASYAEIEEMSAWK